jgi:hypothetical protein
MDKLTSTYKVLDPPSLTTTDPNSTDPSSLTGTWSGVTDEGHH